MKFGAAENRARLAVALIVLALLLTITLSLALYSEAREELLAERRNQIRREAALLAHHLDSQAGPVDDRALEEILRRYDIKGAAAVYAADGGRLASAARLDQQADLARLFPARRGAGNQADHSAGGQDIRSEAGFEIAEHQLANGAAVALGRASQSASSAVIFYVVSYQIVALVVGLGLIILVARWLLRPYRRMVEAARGSPVHALHARTESEFVVETFQALVRQLQEKERELAQLHALERQRADRSERFSERLIVSIPSGLVSVDAAGRVTSANAQALALFDPPAESLRPAAHDGDGGLQRLSADFRDFFRQAPRLGELVAECLKSGAAFRREEADMTRPDGSVRHLGLSVSPITDAAQRVEGAICLMTDITEVIELRERMKLQDNLAHLGEMAAGLAHEFKNSLATIQGYVQLEQSRSTGALEGRRRTLDAMFNEVQLLARLVTDFLNFARPQQLHLSEVDLAELIEACAQEVAATLQEAGVRLRVTGTFARLPGDEMLLRRAFVNLLRNAAEAIDPQAGEKIIEIQGSADAGGGRPYAHIRVRDTGGGIAPEDLHRIFIPFFTTKSRGYGIGLALVQKIFVAHGGDVSVERSDAGGTTFHCRLPLEAGAMGKASHKA